MARLQEKLLAVVGLTTFEDLGVSSVDVVIRGLSMSFDCGFAVARATNRNTSSIFYVTLVFNVEMKFVTTLL